jgi:NodT family efflux transporter outer membrane factor (OMF) lipoprotein
MKAVWVTLLAGTALSLSACDLAPAYHAPIITVPVSYKESTLWRAAHPADTITRGNWWTLFDDADLNRLEDRVDGANPSLAAALASYDQARAFAAESEAGLFPQLAVGGRLTTNRQSNRRPLRGHGQPNQYMDNALDVQAVYEVDVWDRVANQVKAGKAAAQASAADLETLQLGLHAELASDYLTLRGLDAQAKLLHDTLDAYTKALELTQNRFAGKIASGIDVARAQTQLDVAQASVADIAARRDLLEHAIAVLVGVSPAQLAIRPEVTPLRMPQIDAGLPSTLLERRPDIAAAERQIAAANAEIGVTRAAFYPNISLNMVAGLESTGLDLFGAPNNMWSLGPGLALPLFEGGLRHAEEAVAVAAYREAQANYRQTVLQAFQEVEDQLSLLHWLGDEQTSEDAAAKAAQQSLDMSMSLYRDGAVSYLEVVTAQSAAVDAEIASLSLATRRLDAAVGLIRALGGGWRTQDLPDGQSLMTLADSIKPPTSPVR